MALFRKVSLLCAEDHRVFTSTAVSYKAAFNKAVDKAEKFYEAEFICSEIECVYHKQDGLVVLYFNCKYMESDQRLRTLKLPEGLVGLV